jgi:hypothetical protein
VSAPTDRQFVLRRETGHGSNCGGWRIRGAAGHGLLGDPVRQLRLPGGPRSDHAGMYQLPRVLLRAAAA